MEVGLRWSWGHCDLQPILWLRGGPAQRAPSLPTTCLPTQVFWEDGIMSGYRRPTSSALDCVLSSFQMTNETVNIWTHFLPTW